MTILGKDKKHLRLYVFFAFLIFASFPLLLPTAAMHRRPLVNDIYPSDFSLMSITQRPDGYIHSGNLMFSRPQNLSEIKSIYLKIGTYRGTSRILRATIDLSPGCKYTLPNPVEIYDGYILKLVKSESSCQEEIKKDIKIEIQTELPQRLAFIGYSSWSETKSNPQITFQGEDGKKIFVAGYYEINLPEKESYLPRIESLLEEWQYFGVSTSLAFIFLFSTIVSTCICLAAIITGSKNVMIFAILSLSLAYLASFLAPPFQAPDEMDHFLAFIGTAQVENAVSKTVELANKSHFDRLMCHVDEKIDGESLIEPMQLIQPPYFHVAIVNMESRSAYYDTLWKYLGFTYLKEWPVVRLHFLLRIFNSTYVALIIFLSLLFAGKGVEDFDIFKAFFPLLLIPTFWHFISHNSNHGIMIAHFLPCMLVIAPFVRGLSVKWYYWIWLGLSTGLAICSGRSGLVFATFLGGLIIVRMISLLLQNKVSWAKETGSILVTVAASTIPIILLKNSPYIQSYVPSLIKYAALENGPIASIMLAILIIVLTFGIFLFLKKIGTFDEKKTKSFVKKSSFIMIIFLVSVAVWPLFKNIGTLPSIEWPMPVPGKLWYLRQMLKYFWLQQGAGGIDFFLIGSFWGGFGCPEQVWPSIYIQLLKLTPIAGLIFSYHNTSQNKKILDFFLITSMLILSMIYFLMLGFGVLSDLMNIHGRYLLPFYIVYIATSSLNINHGKSQSNYDKILRILCCLVPIISVYFVTSRYF